LVVALLLGLVNVLLLWFTMTLARWVMVRKVAQTLTLWVLVFCKAHGSSAV